MITQLARKLSKAVIDKPLPPLSDRERTALTELQTTFRSLPVMSVEHALPTEAVWLENMNRIRELVLLNDSREFLRWDVISETMFIDHARYILPELKYLKHLSDWKTRWRTAIQESPVGHPIHYILHPSSSGNLIHHAYHVAQFEEKTDLQVNRIGFVLEFGGGYGSMCRLFYNLGFRGRYVIFDLPPFSALQKYYLKVGGFPVRRLSTSSVSEQGISCISEMEQLRAFLGDQMTQMTDTLFIATWSISETPIGFRESLLSLVSSFKSFLIAYRNKFKEVDNLAFFERWQKTNPTVAWHNWQIKQIPGNSYLMGRMTP
jgi:hypothetical protein